MVEKGKILATSDHWDQERSQGYSKLTWVKAAQPLNKIVELAQLKGNEIVVDAGTGSQAVLDTLAPHLIRGGRIIGFDISLQMILERDGTLPANASLLLADIYKTPFANDSIDLITSRQVYHNLSDIEAAVAESRRILRLGGRLMIIEYAPLASVYDFDRMVFDIKEPGRNLWTGEQLWTAVSRSWGGEDSVSLDFALLPQNSVVNWMKNSGLPKRMQQAVFSCYLDAPVQVQKEVNMTIKEDGDILVDRPFAYVVATKH